MENPFLNKYEQLTYSKIKAVAGKVGAHVFSKVRLADFLPINKSGIPASEFRFALQSHVDFLVTDSEYKQEFSIEFDGPTHTSPDQINRDQKKNNLLKRFEHPFIRINSRYLDDKYRGLDLLTYFVDVWFLAKAFYEAQSQGHIPYDEPFDPAFIISDGTPDGRSWPYWLSIELQNKIRKLCDAGRVVQIAPCHWIGEDKSGNLRCISWIFITKDTCIYIETGMREHHFPAVFCSDLLSQIAVFELYDKLLAVLDRTITPIPGSKLDKHLEYYKSSYKMHFVSSCSIGSEKEI